MFNPRYLSIIKNFKERGESPILFLIIHHCPTEISLKFKNKIPGHRVVFE